MRTTPPAPKARAASKSAKTTINLDADIVAKMRASLRAVGRREPLEKFVEGILGDMLESSSGVFEGLIESRDEHRRPEIESKLDRIRQGDSRLVRLEAATPDTKLTISVPGKVERMLNRRNATPERYVAEVLAAAYNSTNLAETLDDLYPVTGKPGYVQGLIIIQGA